MILEYETRAIKGRRRRSIEALNLLRLTVCEAFELEGGFENLFG